MNILIYTDGGADPNPGIGGWAAILQYGEHEKVLTGHDPDTTNNRMELTAAIHALRALNRPSTVDIHVDSEYVRRGITEWIDGWAERNWVRRGGKPVPNADLWQTLWALTKQHTITWHWVRGHSGDPLNERVDRLARQARLEITPGSDVSAESPRVYLRASVKGNPGPGGWGVVLEHDDETRQLSGSVDQTTNNRMELEAALNALTLVEPGAHVQLFTTSDYVYQGATRWIHGWRRRNWKKRDGKPVANADLWQALDAHASTYKIAWINAKGESHQGLEEAGLLAADAARLAAESRPSS